MIQDTNLSCYCPICQAPIIWENRFDTISFRCSIHMSHIQLLSSGSIRPSYAYITYNFKLLDRKIIPINIYNHLDLFRWVCRIGKLQAFE